jgi:hypothetical protein
MTTDDPGLGYGMRAKRELLGGIVALLLMGWLLQSCGVDFNVKSLKADACRECGADGKASVNCIQCRGRGYYEGVKCEACNHTGKVEQTCRFCGGTGKKPK